MPFRENSSTRIRDRYHPPRRIIEERYRRDMSSANNLYSRIKACVWRGFQSFARRGRLDIGEDVEGRRIRKPRAFTSELKIILRQRGCDAFAVAAVCYSRYLQVCISTFGICILGIGITMNARTYLPLVPSLRTVSARSTRRMCYL